MNENKSRFIIVGLVVVALILIIVGYFFFRSSISSIDADIPQASSTGSLVDRDGATGEKAAILIATPQSGQRIGSPIVISGEARVFENTVYYRLRAQDGSVISEGYTTAQAQEVGEWGAFRGELTYEVSKAGRGVVEIFEISAKDGSEINKVSIPVNYTVPPEFFKG